VKLAGIVARFNAQKAGNGWEARCPVHDDQHPSLSIKGGDKHPLVLKCGANCSTADVLAAVGLSLADCYPEGKRQSTTPLRKFDYTDEQGTIEYQVRRYNRATNKFAMFHSTAEGWTKGRGPGPKRLYRLAQLAAEPDVLDVWLTEGERDADSLADHCGILTTTAASGDITNADTTPLRGKYVVVVIDNDKAGWLKGRKTAAAAVSAGAFVCDVWRPTDAFKDATEAVRAGKDCDTGFVVFLGCQVGDRARPIGGHPGVKREIRSEFVHPPRRGVVESDRNPQLFEEFPAYSVSRRFTNIDVTAGHVPNVRIPPPIGMAVTKEHSVRVHQHRRRNQVVLVHRPSLARRFSMTDCGSSSVTCAYQRAPSGHWTERDRHDCERSGAQERDPTASRSGYAGIHAKDDSQAPRRSRRPAATRS
jgi:hypothetical protein